MLATQAEERKASKEGFAQLQEKLFHTERMLFANMAELDKKMISVQQILECQTSYNTQGSTAAGTEALKKQLELQNVRLQVVERFLKEQLELHNGRLQVVESSLEERMTHKTDPKMPEPAIAQQLELHNQRLEVVESSLEERMTHKMDPKMPEPAIAEQLELHNQRLQVVERSLEEQTTKKMDPDMPESAIAQEECVQNDIAIEPVPELQALGAKDCVVPRHYAFDESVYDASIFAFTTCVDAVSSVFIVIGFIVNLAMQVGVVIILAWRFAIDPLPEEVEQGFERWRASKGHAASSADPVTGTSLLARVCAMDSALSSSGSQLELRTDFNDYFGLFGFQGQLLCIIAIVLWSFTCANEIRKSIAFVLALLRVPRGKGQSTISVDEEGVHVLNFHFCRLLIGCGVALCRFTIASLLLVYGSWWLAYTISLKDLLLNASALGFVLDIDEMIFSVLAPVHLIGLIDSVEPLTMPSDGLHSFAMPFGLGISILTFVITINFTWMKHMSDRLSLVHGLICNPDTNLDFVVGSTDMGWMYYSDSTPFYEPERAVTISQREVLQLIMNKDPEAQKFVTKVTSPLGITKNAQYLETHVATPMVEVAQRLQCYDQEGPLLGGRLYTATGDTSLRDVETCAEVKQYCREGFGSLLGQNLRLMCPVTCGCSDPQSGLFHLSTSNMGCPADSCAAQLYDAIWETFYTYGCQDKTLTELQTMPAWSQLLDLINETILDFPYYEATRATVGELRSTGCKAFQSVAYADRLMMCGVMDPFAEGGTLFGAGVMCPESCGCYYDYCADPEVTPGFRKYVPGENAICPVQSCLDRYRASATKYGEEHGTVTVTGAVNCVGDER